jgi:phosphonate transport system substrate-binding protein
MMKRLNHLLLIIITGYIYSGCAPTNGSKAVQVDMSSHEPISLESSIKDPDKLYVAVSAMISPMETFNQYNDLIEYISEKTGIPIEFKQRRTYEEVNLLLKEQKIDFAFICTGAYLKAKKEFPIELLAVPVVKGSPTYNAYIIVNRNSSITTFNELENKSFAFTDPLSNSGYAYVVNQLEERGVPIDQFFTRTIFTYAHDYSIQAVARNLVDGATIDGLIWDYLEVFQPDKVSTTKIIQKSPDYGIPPFVVRPTLDDSIKMKLRQILFDMHKDQNGMKLLRKIFIERFEEGQEQRYEF